MWGTSVFYLGSLLFVLDINVLPENVKCPLNLYVDIASICVSTENITNLRKKLANNSKNNLVVRYQEIKIKYRKD